MRVYTDRPTARRARAVWDHVTKFRGKEPTALWKNPNCWGATLQVTGNAWGWWVAEFGSHRDTESINPHDIGTGQAGPT